jgi:hypothetical protein
VPADVETISLVCFRAGNAANLIGLFEHHHVVAFAMLLEFIGSREPGRPASYDAHHGFALALSRPCYAVCAHFRTEPVDRAIEAILEHDCRFPTQHAASQADVGAANMRIIFRQLLMADARNRPGLLEHDLRKFADGEFMGIPEIHGPNTGARCLHQGNQAFDHVAHITKGSCL